MNEFDHAALRAENNPKFYSRFKWLGLAAFGFTLYCLYDGYINWPDQQTRALAYKEIAERGLTDEQQHELHDGAHGGNEVYQRLVELRAGDTEVAEEWMSLAEQNDWAPEPPEKLRTDGDIAGQYVMAGIAAIACVWMLTTVLRSNGRWIELADDVINTSWGQSFPLAGVTQINKKQWRDKGIARVKYTHDGRSGTFVVDDYKYHRKTTDEILRRIERIAGVDKITGGPPEPDEAPPTATPAADSTAPA